MEILDQINWRLVLEVIYMIATFLTCIRVILDTTTVQKTMSYLLIVIFLPFIGMFIYFSLGINYRKRKIYNKKLTIVEERSKTLIKNILKHNKELISTSEKNNLGKFQLLKLLANPLVSNNPNFSNNTVDIIINGENFFPDLLEAISKAKHHIHIEYYIYENDNIGQELKNALIAKARQGVQVRFIYDDFGSHSIRNNIVKELQAEVNIEAYAFYEIKLLLLANRLNYRNHRKIIVIDGLIGYTGGINVSDKYINSADSKKFWRDTNVKVTGSAALGLQNVFLSDWNFCSGQNIPVNELYFPAATITHQGTSNVQIVSSGPDYDLPTTLYAFLQAINSAQKEILLTTPYYIPDTTFQQMLILAALRGVQVKLLLPNVSDSKIVRWASQSYYEELLKFGVEIYLYQKGFIHAKTIIVDGQFCTIGTANLDSRSFDLNFEVTAVIYDSVKAQELRDVYYDDLHYSIHISYEKWSKRSLIGRFKDNLVKLLSPLL